jgi:hypothetical protein
MDRVRKLNIPERLLGSIRLKAVMSAGDTGLDCQDSRPFRRPVLHAPLAEDHSGVVSLEGLSISP